jgi:hypothetical protein
VSRVRGTLPAANDFTHIIERIREDNPAAAKRVAQTIQNFAKQLCATTMSHSPLTYFGLWSARDIQKVSELLSLLQARFEVNECDAPQEMLQAWHAWDPCAQNPNIGFDLWVFSDDLPKVGYKVVEMFPERKFGHD